MLAMAFAPAATAEMTETNTEIVPPDHCYLDPTPPGAWADCVVELGLNEAIDTARGACKKAGYDCDSTLFGAN
jgi:hypothetical protein